MWLATTDGFFSIVQVKDDPEHMMIRARRREHLEALFRRFDPKPEILQQDHSDYLYRVLIDRETTGRLVEKLVIEGIDYNNFKSAASAKRPGDHAYVGALHRIWSILHDALDPRPTIDLGDRWFGSLRESSLPIEHTTEDVPPPRAFKPHRSRR